MRSQATSRYCTRACLFFAWRLRCTSRTIGAGETRTPESRRRRDSRANLRTLNASAVTDGWRGIDPQYSRLARSARDRSRKVHRQVLPHESDVIIATLPTFFLPYQSPSHPICARHGIYRANTRTAKQNSRSPRSRVSFHAIGFAIDRGR